MKLENLTLESSKVSGKKVYQLIDLAYMSPAGLYGSGDSCGGSFFKVHLPESNAVDKGLKVFTPEATLVYNEYQRVKGKSGIDYFNPDGSLAGRITGLNKSELDYLDD